MSLGRDSIHDCRLRRESQRKCLLILTALVGRLGAYIVFHNKMVTGQSFVQFVIVYKRIIAHISVCYMNTNVFF